MVDIGVVQGMFHTRAQLSTDLSKFDEPGQRAPYFGPLSFNQICTFFRP